MNNIVMRASDEQVFYGIRGGFEKSDVETFDGLNKRRCLASYDNMLMMQIKSEKEFLKSKKISFLNLPVVENILDDDFEENELYSKLRYTLKKLESSINKGWNHSTAKVLPLGDFDYVRRDLPVYKLGFDATDIKVQKRPKGGLLFIRSPNNAAMKTPTQFIETTDFSVILCLSFNTDHCLNDENFQYIPLNKKINRIKDLRSVLWSKDKFCRTASHALRRWDTAIIRSQLNKTKYSKQDFQFTFPCWIMPTDSKALLSYARRNPNERFISKPRSLGAGKGIYVVEDYDELLKEKRTTNLLQTYLQSPHLIVKESGKGYKWDMRTYVLVTSVVPFRGYLYKRGLVRIATSPYDKDAKCSGSNENKTGCLTNTSINKKVEGATLKDITWSFHKLKKYIGTEKFNFLFSQMKRVIGLTLLSAETSFYQKYHEDSDDFLCQNCYQLLGIDIIATEDLVPKVVEVNGEPSLKLTSSGRSHYDITKKSMAKDLVGLVFNKKSISQSTNDRNNLAMNLLRLSKCINLEYDTEDFFVAKDQLEYVLSTLRERQNLGGFSPVYPTKDIETSHFYETFLRVQHLKESTRDTKGIHSTERRLFLHKLVETLLNSEKLSQND